MQVRKKNVIKKGVDACMTVLLLCLMAYQRNQSLFTVIIIPVALVRRIIVNRKHYSGLPCLYRQFPQELYIMRACP